MKSEQQIIESVCKIFGKSERQLNMPFEADCEILQWSNSSMLFTTDSFSDEDLFRTDDPFILGHNLAVASLSDIYACGGTPVYYAHSLCAGNKWDESFILNFCRGVDSVIKPLKIAFIGGDFGRSKEWSYTASIIGHSEKPVKRSGSSAGDKIYVSGELGAGNFEAALSLFSGNLLVAPLISKFKTKLNLRNKESCIIEKYANSCIDTSDGLFKSLLLLANLNNLGFVIENVPINKAALSAAKILGKDPVLLLAGECGEYELLFSVSPTNEDSFLSESKNHELQFHLLGEFSDSKSMVYKVNGKQLFLNEIDFSARSFASNSVYLKNLQSKIKESWRTDG